MITLSNAIFEVDESSKMCRTIFNDGKVVLATPNYDNASLERANDLGYVGEDPVWQMTREHDLLHSILAEAVGKVWSPTLRSVCGDVKVDNDSVNKEECLALCVARLLNHVRNTGRLLA